MSTVLHRKSPSEATRARQRALKKVRERVRAGVLDAETVRKLLHVKPGETYKIKVETSDGPVEVEVVAENRVS